MVTYERTSLRILKNRLPDPNLPIHATAAREPIGQIGCVSFAPRDRSPEGMIGASLYEFPTTNAWGAWWALEHVH